MRCVTRDTPFGLEWRVFIGKRTLLVCVALDARGVSARGQSCLLQFEAAMRIMTITTLHYSFEHFVMKRLVEVRLHLGMAAHAQLRLAELQEMKR